LISQRDIVRRTSPRINVSAIPSDLRYTPDHEYLKTTTATGIVAVGITDYAQGELGDVVYLELPKPGAKFGAHDTFGTIEAVKAVSELFCPVAGEVVEVNRRLDGEPALVNSDPYGDGWMIKVRLKNPAERDGLLGPDEYGAQLGQ